MQVKLLITKESSIRDIAYGSRQNLPEMPTTSQLGLRGKAVLTCEEGQATDRNVSTLRPPPCAAFTHLLSR